MKNNHFFYIVFIIALSIAGCDDLTGDRAVLKRRVSQVQLQCGSINTQNGDAGVNSRCNSDGKLDYWIRGYCETFADGIVNLGGVKVGCAITGTSQLYHDGSNGALDPAIFNLPSSTISNDAGYAYAFIGHTEKEFPSEPTGNPSYHYDYRYTVGFSVGRKNRIYDSTGSMGRFMQVSYDLEKPDFYDRIETQDDTRIGTYYGSASPAMSNGIDHLGFDEFPIVDPESQQGQFAPSSCVQSCRANLLYIEPSDEESVFLSKPPSSGAMHIHEQSWMKANRIFLGSNNPSLNYRGKESEIDVIDPLSDYEYAEYAPVYYYSMRITGSSKDLSGMTAGGHVQCKGPVQWHSDPNLIPDPNISVPVQWHVAYSSPDKTRHVIHSDFIVAVDDPNGFVPYFLEIEEGPRILICSVDDTLIPSIDPKSLDSFSSFCGFWLNQDSPADFDQDGIVNWKDYFIAME